MINVTQTFLPPFNEYQNILNQAWNKGWITNRGDLVKELEKKLRDNLSVKNLVLMTNGTLPLQIGIRALELVGEIITTPFSYVATSSAIVWERCHPIFVDIDPVFWAIDENKIEDSITDNTAAILVTHVFGNPCNIEVIDGIAKKYDLKVIYDAAHCFGVKYNGQSIFNYGDISTCSFHATKLFHTGEGGALFCSQEELLSKCFYHHNFGHKGQEDFHGLGINAKMSELQAALGLAILPYLDQLISERKIIVQKYLDLLNDSTLQLITIRENAEWNYSYFPVIFESEDQLLKVFNKLKENNIFPRRYFYPSLNTITYLKSGKMEISESIASRVLCLPLYQSLKLKSVEEICNLILEEI